MVKINFWKCHHHGCDSIRDEDGDEYYIYECDHPKNTDKYCDLDNKYRDDVDDCKLLDEKDKS